MIVSRHLVSRISRIFTHFRCCSSVHATFPVQDVFVGGGGGGGPVAYMPSGVPAWNGEGGDRRGLARGDGDTSECEGETGYMGKGKESGRGKVKRIRVRRRGRVAIRITRRRCVRCCLRSSCNCNIAATVLLR